ncbi:DNA-binding response regulator [Mucilaginibacter conchicola]|uniref:DNA-binding response regulator n=1 Tax=Mucilaginibacter conchicola TaxID=2303333 RepID=A0A372NQN2_9SPHI|nr:response regulator [Mucilaginibacter conchicola]RFZ91244.1 DNA-binding response regulator [Mucilaginibacter conchicola]
MNKHIVIIEDDQEILDLLTESLSRGGYRVTPLRHIRTFEELIDLAPDAYIIDELLPVINGHIICMILKSKPQTKNTPVLLISGDHRLEHVASLCEADDYLHKPFDAYHELPERLRSLIGSTEIVNDGNA